MFKYIVFILFAICLHSGMGDEIVSEPIYESLKNIIEVPMEVDDDDEIDSVDTRELRSDLQTLVNCGTALSEPLKVDRIKADLAKFTYEIKDVVITNISKCEVKDLKVNLEKLDLKIHLHCPYLIAIGEVDINGVFIVIPIHGKTPFRIDSENNNLILNTKLKKLFKHGRAHVKIDTYTIKLDIEGPVVYKFTKLFEGNEAMSTAAHQHVNSNWKPATAIVQSPFYYGMMKHVFKNINKCLKPVPIVDLDL